MDSTTLSYYLVQITPIIDAVTDRELKGNVISV